MQWLFFRIAIENQEGIKFKTSPSEIVSDVLAEF